MNFSESKRDMEQGRGKRNENYFKNIKAITKVTLKCDNTPLQQEIWSSKGYVDHQLSLHNRHYFISARFWKAESKNKI